MAPFSRGRILIYLLVGIQVELRYFLYINALLGISAVTTEPLLAMSAGTEKPLVMVKAQWLSA